MMTINELESALRKEMDSAASMYANIQDFGGDTEEKREAWEDARAALQVQIAAIEWVLETGAPEDLAAVDRQADVVSAALDAAERAAGWE